MRNLTTALLFLFTLVSLPLSAEAGRKSKNHTPVCQNYLDDIPAFEDDEYYHHDGEHIYGNTDEIDPRRGQPGPDDIFEPGDGGSARDPGGF